MKEFRYRIVLEQVVRTEAREEADSEHAATLASLNDRDDVKIVDRHVYAARKASK